MDSNVKREMKNLADQIENVSNQIEISLKSCENLLANILFYSNYDFKVLKEVEFLRKKIFLSKLYLEKGKKAKGKKVFLMGGGIGVPPILELAKQLDFADRQVIAGYRDKATFLKEEFEANGTLYISTEDGSVGTKGNVLDAVRENGLSAEIIYACGPTPMLRAVKQYAEEKHIECYISLEERMACGIGACLGCVCKTKEKDSHSNVNNKRICKDGPVFAAAEVEL